jgi:hypothetical protein
MVTMMAIAIFSIGGSHGGQYLRRTRPSGIPSIRGFERI